MCRVCHKDGDNWRQGIGGEPLESKQTPAPSFPPVSVEELAPSPIGAIVLAAGRSQRMQVMAAGISKQLLSLGGQPLFTFAVGAACASRATPVIVVLGAEAERAQAALGAWAAKDATNRSYQCVVNPDFAQGMASSLRMGLVALREQEPGVAGAVITLADMPLVTPYIIDTLLATAQSEPSAIVAATYDGKRGHPIIFPNALFDELAQVTGDEGGRSVIARHPDRLRLVPIADTRAALDVDRPEDYAAISSFFERK